MRSPSFIVDDDADLAEVIRQTLKLSGYDVEVAQCARSARCGGRAHRALDQWAYKHGVKLHFIRTGKPMGNGCIESFTGKYRDEFLSEHWFRKHLRGRRRGRGVARRLQ
jgi:transposase InsO family protein